MDTSDSDFSREFGARIFAQLARSLVIDGTIDATDKSPDEIRTLVAEWIVEQGDDLEFAITITHERDLLDEARRYAQGEKPEFALMFYATWIEHTLNGALESFGRRHELERAEYVSLVRLPLRDKIGVVWRLVIGSEFPAELRGAIFKVTDARNAFVHYKWAPEPDDLLRDSKAETRALLEVAESVVVDLSSLIEEQTFGTNVELAAWARGDS